jgi:hypothetical protein
MIFCRIDYVCATHAICQGILIPILGVLVGGGSVKHCAGLEDAELGFDKLSIRN